MSENSDIVQIDRDNLDKECLRLPGDYLRAAEQSAEAKRDLTEAENRLAVIKAELSQAVRSTPEDYGLEKVTESSITEKVLSLSKYQKALAATNNRRHSYEITQALVWALEHKKRALTLLVELHGMSYFSSPKTSRAGQESLQQMTQRKVRRFNTEEGD